MIHCDVVTSEDPALALPHVLSAPRDDSRVDRLCFRPRFNRRTFPDRLTLTRDAGVVNERWTPHPWLRLSATGAPIRPSMS